MYVIQTQSGYVKRTSSARPYGGTIRLTKTLEEAKRFTRQTDAARHAKMIAWRCSVYNHDRDKFGLLACDVAQV